MSTTDDSNACLVCREECQYYGIGECNHTVCAKCAIRLKVICKVADCPICRHKSSRILIAASHQKYNSFQTDKFMSLPDEDLLFENQEVLNYYTDLISYQCSDCGAPCNSMSALKRHVNNDHKKRFCLICVEHLQLFPREHQLFDEVTLSEHKRWRPEKPNHGHPKCQICSESFYDAEMWYNHLRRQHFMCHICENLPTLERFHQQRTVYGNYEQLNKHFIACHYVCQEGPCQSDQFTNVFATENELRAHRISQHSGVMDKALIRETRRLNIDIRYQRGGGASGASGGPSGGASTGRGGASRGGAGAAAAPSVPHMPTAREALDQLVNLAPGVREFAANALAQSAASKGADGYSENPEEFPTLSGHAQTKFVGREAGSKTTEEDFPSLSGAAAAAAASVASTTSGSSSAAPPVPPPVYSGPRRVPALAPFSSLISASASAGGRPGNKLDEEYPSLGRPSAATAANSIWGSAAPAAKPKKTASAAAAAAAAPLPTAGSANDFPSLPKPSGPPPTTSVPIKVTPKPRTKPPTPPQTLAEAPKQPPAPQPPPPPDPVEYRPAQNLRYQQSGGVTLQPEEPTVYRPMNSVVCVPADQLHPAQRQQSKANFSLAEDFPSLPTKAKNTTGNKQATSSSNSSKTNATKNRFAALTDTAGIFDKNGAVEGDDWSSWPTAAAGSRTTNSSGKQQQQQQQQKFTGRPEDFPSLSGAAGSQLAAPVWRKDGQPQPHQAQMKHSGAAASAAAAFAPSTPLGLGNNNPPPSGVKKQKKQKKQQRRKDESEASGVNAMVEQQQQQQNQPPRNASWCDLLVREQYVYSPPDGLSDRQTRLLNRLRTCLADDEDFTSFAKASSEYLKGELEAEQFLSQVVNLLGDEEWRLVAPDLITTLPSIGRQRDLRVRLTDDNLRNQLAVCDSCAQTLLPEDLDGHRCLPIEE